jgi:N-acetylglucosamine transport system substrate-binding protein
MTSKENAMFSKKTILNFALIFCFLASLVGCTGGTPSSVAPTQVQTGVTTVLPTHVQAVVPTELPTQTPTVAPTELPTSTPEQITLEVAVESAGYGLDYYTALARDFEALHPGVTVNLWGVPELWKTLQPRFVSGDTPDLVAAVQGIDHSALIAENQILPLNDLLNSPAIGQEGKTFNDTVIPGMLDGGKRGDTFYLFPWNAITYGVFYNEALFKANGWEIPKTWDDLTALCPKIKATGIDCIAFPGVWPEYFTMTAWWELIDRIGGRQAQLDMENLIPGAWNSSTVVKVNGMLRDLVKAGYFQNGWEGQDHTASQTLFVTAKAGMNFNGSWLESEMRNVTPADFQMGFFPIPLVNGGKGAKDMRVGSDWWFIPSKAKQPNLAGEFLKFVFSVENARNFVKTTKSLSPIIGSTVGVDVSVTLSESMAAMEHADSVKPWYWANYYPSLYDLMATDIMGAMLRAEITPQQMADKLEAQAEKIRNDPSITKIKVTY